MKHVRLLFLVLCCCAPLAHGALPDPDPDPHHYQTKTPYLPQQAPASYTAAPAGFVALHTQMLARHGSRGLTAMKSDLALYNLWQMAQQEHALTALGARLGPDILAMMRANALLGHGVRGIRQPGYGNETLQGIAEHRQLAQRLYQRVPAVFGATLFAGQPREIVVVSSGKDRAVDSGAYFAEALAAQQDGLSARLRPTPARAGGEPGTDHFLLYFHKLGKKDLISDPADPLYPTFQASQQYQAWLRSAELREREQAVLARAPLAQAAERVLARLFSADFVAGLRDGRFHALNTGTLTFASTDGRFSSTLEGDASSSIASPREAAQALYELYAAAADMRVELDADFQAYMPADAAQVLAESADAIAFYTKGPGLREAGDANFRIAQILLDDFFSEADAIAAGNLRHAAKLRFAHAETIIPLAALLGLEGMATPLPRSELYSYASSDWRGARVAPMAANLQWDLYANPAGTLLVRMLYNEKETAFKPACDAARIAPGSFFYDYARLRACYRQRAGV